jgi:hypothetical protein
MSDTWEYRVTKAGGIEIWLVNGIVSQLIVAIPAEAIRQAVANVEPGVGWRREEARGTFDPEDMA